MKAFKYILISGLAALSLNSCDFLKSESPSAMDAQGVYSNAMFTRQAIAGIYETFGQDRSYRNRLATGYIGLNTDAEFCTKGSCVWADYSLTPAWDDISRNWNYFNVATERCNNAIEGLEQYGDIQNNATMRAYLGEVYFLRAFLYLEMVKIWGEVPARWESLTKNPDGVNQGLVYRNDIYEHNRADLKKAIEYLPWAALSEVGDMKNNTGRASKGAAYAMLMRNNMYYAGMSVHRDDMPGLTGKTDFTPDFNVDLQKQAELYAEVVEAMQMLEAFEPYKLLENFVDVFKTVCEDKTTYTESEVMWEIPFANAGRGQFLQYNCPKSADALLGLKNNDNGSTNSIQTIVPTLYYEFEDGDVRRDITMVPFQWIYDNGTKYNSDLAKVQEAFPLADGKIKFLYQKVQPTGDWYLGKYRVEWMARKRGGNDDGVNYPVIRYADCLLLGAEAALYLNNAEAVTWFNRVHQRAGLAAKGSITLDDIKAERRFELTGEYQRRWDLIRWGELKETMEATAAKLTEMDRHEGIFEGLGDTIYYKYREIVPEDKLTYDANVKGYVIDSVWGLKPGETGTCPYAGQPGWVKKNMYESSGGRELSEANYRLYDFAHPNYLNWHQYYPIFNTILSASTTLKNSYNY